MARSLDLRQEADTVRICANSNIVEKHSASEVPSAHVRAPFISLQLLLSTNMLFFFSFDASWSGNVTSVCIDMLQIFFRWVPSSMSY